MKCRVCRQPAIIDIRRHNANFCAEHFLRLCRDQVAKAIDEFAMIAEGERVLVAVSGGKDSLALWDLLLDLGHQADGLYLGLGIGEYSDRSHDHARQCVVRTGRQSSSLGRKPDERGRISHGRPRLEDPRGNHGLTTVVTPHRGQPVRPSDSAATRHLEPGPDRPTLL